MAPQPKAKPQTRPKAISNSTSKPASRTKPKPAPKPASKPRKHKIHDDIIAACRVAPVSVVAAEFGCTPSNVSAHLARERAYASANPPRRVGRGEKFDKHDKRRIRTIVTHREGRSEGEMLAVLDAQGFSMGPQLFRRLCRAFGLVARK